MEKPMDPATSAHEAQRASPTAGGTATTPTRAILTATITQVPISDPDERHRSNKIKSFSQPLGRDIPSALKKKQHSLEFSSSATTAGSAAATANSGRSYSYPHYQAPNPLTVGDPPNPDSSNTNTLNPNAPLPEFTGSGGGTGIFKLPVRAPMHPGRPPPLELRPHPLRETQVGSYLRTVACTRNQLWAATECGVRFWELANVFGEHKGRRRGDEESAPFRDSSRTPPAMCLVVDEQRGLVWTGHKDGRIRSWKAEQGGNDGDEGGEKSSPNFKEGLSWHAHRCAVLSLVITSNGELWSGHESGVIKAWPWETIEKSLSLTTEERHMAALLIERSFIDLRSLVTVEGICPLPSVNVRHLLSDNSRSKVWSGGSQSFALWDSRKKELLKVFGINGQVEIQVDQSHVHDPYSEDDMKVKLVSSTKKEKSQGSGGFFQRSRNALVGAADAVRRVAAKGAFVDDRKIEALTLSVDGIIWLGCSNGSLIQWDGNGNRLQEFQHRSFSVHCICTFGARIWVGYANGNIQIMDLEGTLLGGWVAHSSAVVRMAIGGSYIFSLANHGGIRGWYLASPGPLDGILRAELTNKEVLYSKRENFKFLAGTWNVGQERATHDSLVTWLACAKSEVSLVVVGLQEIEMGAGFLAMAAAKESVGLEGSVNGQWWLDAIGKSLDEGMSFERVGSRQLAGLLIGVWARKNLKPQIGDVDVAAVPCGLGRAIGNKGAVGLRMRVFDRTICFVNCHLAAHLEAVNKRNADFDHIYRSMTFGQIQSTTGAASVQLHRGSNPTDVGKLELSEADMIVFLGDFNYRLRGISYDEARDLVSQRCFDWLREKDQLRAEMKAGKVFQGLREAHIKFPPTYKFDRDTAGLSGYDSGEKKRIPAWCDRILYRDNRFFPEAECSLACPIVASIVQYDACLDVTGSDHKPVRCIFNIDIARVDELIKRQQYGELVNSNDKARMLVEDFLKVPETTVSTNEVVLPNQDASVISITNNCSLDIATFEIICEVHSSFRDNEHSSETPSRSPFGFPNWLKVNPAAGVIKPGQTVDVSLRHEDMQNTLEDLIDGVSQSWWAEDTRDQEAVIAINITGSRSTEKRCHSIHIRQSSSCKLPCKESNSSLTKNLSKRR